MKSKKVLKPSLFYFLLAIATFFLFYTAMVSSHHPIGTALEQWQVKKGNGWQDVRVPLIELNKPQSEILELRTTFSRIDADTLVIPRQSGNAIEIRLNGELIYSLGNFAQPTANLWNYVHLVKLPTPLADKNVLEVRIISSYFGSGFNAIPYLCRYQEGANRVVFLNWLYSDLSHAISGSGLIVGLILIIMAYIRRDPISPELLMGLALVFSVFFIQDTPFRITTGSLTTFLWMKKGYFVSGYFASLCFLCGLEKLTWNRIKISRWFALMTAIAIVIFLFMPDLYSLNAVLTYTNAALFINLTVVILIIVIGKQNLPWMLFPATLLSLSLLSLIVAVPLNLTYPLMMPYVILTTTLMVGGKLILDFNQLFLENINLQRIKNIDPLTGVLNRNVLAELNPGLHDYIVMIDIDGFKGMNDRYGHAFGDQLLVGFSKVIRQNLRQNDLIIRYGGDEFILVMNHLPKNPEGYDVVDQVLKRIQIQYSALYPDISASFSYGIAPIEGRIEESLKIADKRMYSMKYGSMLDS